MKEPPDTFIKIILVILAFIGWACVKGYGYSPKTPAELNLERENELIIVDRHFLKASVSPNNDFTGTKIVRVVTAYNPVKSQTDSTPCIAASGLNICETNKKIFASNEFEFGQKIVIDGVIWECQDRINSRYKYRIDLLMYDYDKAREWGKQIKEVILLN